MSDDIYEGNDGQEQAALKTEATDATVAVEFRGITYEVQRSAAGELDFLEALEDRRMIAAARGLLGRSQWEKFKPTVASGEGYDAVLELLNAITAAAKGMTVPE